MTIVQRLTDFYAQCQAIGYIPSSVGVSDEEYDEYNKSLKDMSDVFGLVWLAKPTKLSYKGIELVKYGKRHKGK